MKKQILASFALAIILAPCCQKNDARDNGSAKEIVLAVSDAPVEIFTGTKAITPVSSLPASLYWGATTGSGSESTKWASASGTVSAGKISTGKYQTATPTTYNYYLSNVSMSIGANTTVSATGGTSGTDVICGRASSSSATPSVTMDHVFARTGSITTTCANGSLTGLSYTIKAKGDNTGTSGTYNLRTGAWSSTSGITSDTAITGASDLYLIPGDYTIKATGTYTRGGYVATKTMTGTVTLTGGKINNIALTWPDGGTEIVITVTLTPWGSPITANSSVDICPAIDMGGTSTVLYAAWNVGATSEGEYGDYFAWGEVTKRYTNSAASLQNQDRIELTGPAFNETNAPYYNSGGWEKYIFNNMDEEEASFWTGDGEPDDRGTLDPSDDTANRQWGMGWRMPTSDDLQWLIDNCTWTFQENYKGTGTDGYLATGPNSAKLFFPIAGCCTGNKRQANTSEGYYWCSTRDHYNFGWGSECLLLVYEPAGDDYSQDIVGGRNRGNGYSVRAVKPKS